MSPFDTQVYHEHQICLRFHQILKVILEMAFSAHCTPIWKLNRISTTIINKVTRKCIWCCHRAQRCVTSPGFGVKLCSGAWKRGPDSHVGTFSLCAKFFVLIFYCTFHEILLLLIVEGGAINFDALHQLLYLFPVMSLTKWPPSGYLRTFRFPDSKFSLASNIKSKLQYHITYVYSGRSLLVFSNITFKMAAWQTYLISWHLDSVDDMVSRV